MARFGELVREATQCNARGMVVSTGMWPEPGVFTMCAVCQLLSPSWIMLHAVHASFLCCPTTQHTQGFGVPSWNYATRVVHTPSEMIPHLSESAFAGAERVFSLRLRTASFPEYELSISPEIFHPVPQELTSLRRRHGERCKVLSHRHP